MLKSKATKPQELYKARKQREEQVRMAYLPPGLYNHGNTCFMNSVLQGLIATRLLFDLTQFQPISPQYGLQSVLLIPQKSPLLTNGQGGKFEQPWVKTMPIGDVLLDILLAAWKSQLQRGRETISPKALLSILGQKYDQYLDFAQQDAHEFLRILLDATRMEEIDVIKQRQPPQSVCNNGPPMSAWTPEKMISPENRLLPLADMVFGGQLTSVLVCQKCKHISQTWEDFNDISLSLKAEDYRIRRRDRLINFAKRLTSFHTTTIPASGDLPQSPPLPGKSDNQEAHHIALNEQLDQCSLGASLPSQDTTNDQQITASQDDARTLFRVPTLSVANGISAESRNNSEGSVSEARSEKKSWGRKDKDNWVLLGKRFSMTVGLGKTSKEPKEQDNRLGSDKTSPELSLTSLSPGPVPPTNDGIMTGTRTSANSTTADNSPHPQTPTIMLSRPPSPSHNSNCHGKAQDVEIPRSTNFHSPCSLPVRSKSPKPPQPSRDEMEYLRAILADTSPASNMHFHLLKQNHKQDENIWLSVGHFSGLEECLRMFTSVEVLDGDNMVGCRRCWKIANGIYSKRSSQEKEGDGDSESEEGEVEDVPLKEEFENVGARPKLEQLSPTLAIPSSRLPTSVSSPTVAFFSHPNQSDQRSISSLPEVSPTRESEDGPIPSRPSVTLIPYETPILLQDNQATPSNAISIPEHPSLSAACTDTVPLEPSAFQSFVLGNSPQSSVAGTAWPDLASSHPVPCSPKGSFLLPNQYHHLSFGMDESDGESEKSTSHSTDQNMESQPPGKRRRSLPKPVLMRPAYKRYLIGTAPPVLVIHLKRFQQISKQPVMSFSHSFKKIDDYVTFPEFLDLRPYLAPKKEDFGLGNKPSTQSQIRREEKEKCMYRLYAVVVHIGNMLGGHYIAYTALPEVTPREDHSDAPPDQCDGSNSSRQWAYISDTIVRLTTLEEVLKAKAYICMYERM